MGAVSFTNDVPSASLLAGNVGFLTGFEHIESVTVGSSTTSVTFSNIPQYYRHLQIRGIVKRSDNSNGGYLGVRLNGDTASNYASHFLAGDGAVTGSGSQTSSVNGLMYVGINTAVDRRPVPGNSTANLFGAFIYDILDYSNTVKNKTGRGLIGQDGNGSGAIQLGSGLWMSTATVTSLTFWMGGDTMAQNSTFSLYGIR